jgi:hypothetical protein
MSRTFIEGAGSVTHVMEGLRTFSTSARAASVVIMLHASALAQSGADINGSDSSLYYLLLIVAGLGCIGVALHLSRKKKREESLRVHYNYRQATAASYDVGGVDADQELEWLRKAKKSSKAAAGNGRAARPATPGVPAAKPVQPDTAEVREFQERMRKLQYAGLPINRFGELRASRLYEPLPLSTDESLINAIDQANEEFEEDEAVRDLAVRVLAAFRTRNSVEALTQIALYDLSSALRSKAVNTLADFDHESVFETILLACADPTREVRAAAARGLFRLSFDRADAWTRIVETNDEYRMRQAARAAIEAGIVTKSFDRLVHDDIKVSYEAYCLVILLIRAGETRDIFEAITVHRDERVRYALVHCLKAAREEQTFDTLRQMQHDSSLPTDVAERIRNAVASFDVVAA